MGNIIPFPNLRKRLLEKGLEALQAKQCEKALRFFYEAEQLEPLAPEIELSVVICLFETGNWEEAKERCQRLLEQQAIDDAELFPIYVAILIQLQQYEQAEAIIEKALQRRYLPLTIREHFMQLLQFSRKMNASSSSAFYNEEIRQWLESEQAADQLKAIQQLQKGDRYLTLSLLKPYLKKESSHPMVKTMALRLLTKHRIEEPIEIVKFKTSMTVVPAELDEAAETKFAADVLQVLERELGNDNPSLQEMAAHIWLRYVYMLYPFSPEPPSREAWAAALHVTVCRLHAIEAAECEIAERYGARVQEVEELCKKLHEIEEISFI
jgi:tetratricopeptide (TPR) repeat protein